MASDFQRSKIAGVFEAMDRERRGYLVEDDFVALATRWTTLRGLAPDSEHYARLQAIMLGWWSSLASASQDGARATLDDVMAVVDQLPAMLGAVSATADAMFEAVDANGDGRISAAEYRQLIEAWNGRATDSDEGSMRVS